MIRVNIRNNHTVYQAYSNLAEKAMADSGFASQYAANSDRNWLELIEAQINVYLGTIGVKLIFAYGEDYDGAIVDVDNSVFQAETNSDLVAMALKWC